MIELEVIGALPVAHVNVAKALDEAGLWMLQSIQRNFELGGRPTEWPPLKRQSGVSGFNRPLMDKGDLYNSGEYKVVGTEMTVTWGRGIPYAFIHNFGGTTHPKVTLKSKKFFWAMYFETGEEFWKWMALKKVGEVLNIEIPARVFMMFQDSDIEHITGLFANYAVEFEGTSESVGVSRTGTDSFV